MRFCRGERPFAPTIAQICINTEFPNLIHEKPTLVSFAKGGNKAVFSLMGFENFAILIIFPH